jgi:L-glutamine-phosphate cytidylyltransferase
MKREANLRVVLLVAGRGSRLGGDVPKCLTAIGESGQTILDWQAAALVSVSPQPIVAVVGYERELVERAHPELQAVRNDRYAETNTAKSLLCALEPLRDCDVLWLNGDVVFDRRIIPLLLRQPQSCMAVNRAVCGEEEIKYRTDDSGAVVEVSKQVKRGEGEAVGINLVKAADLALFTKGLADCGDRDYFERGLELAIGRGMRLCTVDIGDLPCVEIDFPQDLERARRLFARVQTGRDCRRR